MISGEYELGRQPNIVIRTGKLLLCVVTIGGLAAGAAVFGVKRMASMLDSEQLDGGSPAPLGSRLYRPDPVDRELEQSMCDPAKCTPKELPVIQYARVDRGPGLQAAGLSMAAVAENISDPIVVQQDRAYVIVGRDALAADKGIVKWPWDAREMRLCATHPAENPQVRHLRLGRDVNQGSYKAPVGTYRARPLIGDACYQSLQPHEVMNGQARFVRPTTTTSPPVINGSDTVQARAPATVRNRGAAEADPPVTTTTTPTTAAVPSRRRY